MLEGDPVVVVGSILFSALVSTLWIGRGWSSRVVPAGGRLGGRRLAATEHLEEDELVAGVLERLRGLALPDAVDRHAGLAQPGRERVKSLSLETITKPSTLPA